MVLHIALLDPSLRGGKLTDTILVRVVNKN